MRAIASGVVIGALIGAAIMPPASLAQPAPDVARAKDLYKSAEAAVAEGRFLDAARDYGGAYEITRDPVLFFKIGSANERAGKCDLALIYYGRYLREARPSEAFTTLTRERIVACGGDPDAPADPGAAGSGSATSAGSAAGAATSAGSAAGSGSATSAGSGSGSGSGSATPPVHLGASNRGAWVLVASSIALVTVGGVLAYAASSSENDISDLYVGFAGQPPAFDARTQKQYETLVDEGRRYERLSWLTFGLAGASALGAALLFYRGSDEGPVRVTPAVTPTGGGVSATVRW